MIKRLKRFNWKRVNCWVFHLHHDWQFEGKDDDWLNGGSYFYVCRRCGHGMVSTPYMGGKV